MPLYEFECAKCGHKVEELQKFSDPPPLCSKDQTEMVKIVSGFKTRKGAGLYSLDTYELESWGEYKG